MPEASKLESRITNKTDSTAPVQSLTNSNDEVTHRRPMIKDIPLLRGPHPNQQGLIHQEVHKVQKVQILIQELILIQRKFSVSRRLNSGNIPKARQVIFPRTLRIGRFNQCRQSGTQCFTKETDIDIPLKVIQEEYSKVHICLLQ